MIIQIENKNPKIAFLTVKGKRVPKKIWKDTETGITGLTKKDVITHNNRLNTLGITTDMTHEQAIQKAREFIESKKKLQ